MKKEAGGSRSRSTSEAIGERGEAWHVVRSPWMFVLAGAALRGFVLHQTYEPSEFWGGDARTYLETLEGLLRGVIVPAAYVWPPGYPLLALPMAPVLGAGQSLLIVAALTGMLTPAIVLIAGRAAGYPRLAGVVCAITAFYPEAIRASAQPLAGASALFAYLAALFVLEAGHRCGRRYLGVVAGGLGALATLTRSELVVGVALLGVIGWFGRGRSRQVALLYAVTVALAILPWVLALHGASGAWALSLKPHFNVLRGRVYAGETGWIDQRTRWDDYVKGFNDEHGDFSPRLLASAVSPSEHVLSARIPSIYADHVRNAIGRTPPIAAVLWIVGLAGLLLVPGDQRRDRFLLLCSGTPLVLVPLFFPPTVRYTYTSIVPLAYGAGTLLLRGDRFVTSRRWRLRGLMPSLIAAFAVAGTVSALRQTRGAHWRSGEFELELARGNLVAAGRLVDIGLHFDTEDSHVLEALGRLEEKRGQLTAAIDAYEQAAESGGDPIHLAALLVRVGRYDRADALLATEREQLPNTAEYWAVEGNLAFHREDWDAAARFFQRARAAGAPADLMNLNAGMALLRGGRRAESETLLRQAARSKDASIRGEANKALGNAR